MNERHIHYSCTCPEGQNMLTAQLRCSFLPETRPEHRTEENMQVACAHCGKVLKPYYCVVVPGRGVWTVLGRYRGL